MWQNYESWLVVDKATAIKGGGVILLDHSAGEKNWIKLCFFPS